MSDAQGIIRKNRWKRMRKLDIQADSKDAS